MASNQALLAVLEPFAKAMQESLKALKPLMDEIKKVPKKKLQIAKEVFGKIKGIGTVALGPISMILSVLDAFGVAEPLLSAVTAILSLIGGSIMKTLMPALQKLMDILFSPEMIELWVLLGNIIGKMLAPVLVVFAVVLKALMPIFNLLLKLFGPIMVPVITMLAKALGMLILVGFLPLVAAIYGIGMVVAFFVDLFTGKKTMGKWKKTMGGIMGTMLGGMGEIIAMQHGGIVTRPTIALLGEKGPELVTPLGPEGFPVGQDTSNEEVIWALEDNGEKLDMIYMALKQKGRLR